MHELKRMLRREIKEIEMDGAKRGELERSKVETLKILTGALKNIYEICMFEDEEDEGGYSGARRGGGRRGQHYVRAHYSHDGYEPDDYSGARGRRGDGRDARGRYSSTDGREEILDHLSAAMEASTDADKAAIRRLMDRIERDL